MKIREEGGIMRKITERKKMLCDLDTANLLIEIFGIKIMEDIEIRKPEVRKEDD